MEVMSYYGDIQKKSFFIKTLNGKDTGSKVDESQHL